jgi:hypothetical protein
MRSIFFVVCACALTDASVVRPRAVLGAARARLHRHFAQPSPKHLAPAAVGGAPLAFMPLVIPGVRTISDAALFPLVNLALPAWILLIVFPRRKFTKTVVHCTALAFAALYVALLLPILAAPGAASSFSQMASLEGITALFSEPSAVMIGWIHYVVFDLWTARYIVADASKLRVDRVGSLWRVPHPLVVPCLLATLLCGPAGLLAYATLRFACIAYRKSDLIKRPGAY